MKWFEPFVLEYVEKNPGCGSAQISNALDEYVNFNRTGGKRNWFIFYMARLARKGLIRKYYGEDGSGAVQYYLTDLGEKENEFYQKWTHTKS